MAAETQTYDNHRRTVPLFHFVLALCLLVNVAWRVSRVANARSADTAVDLVVAIALILMWVFIRTFPLKAQDRIIRLEMQVRMRDVLPADLQPRIRDFTPRQLIAMRFASDSELPSLAALVLKDNIRDGNAIKKLIKEWQPDHLRV
jgi:hypothetical protein